MKKIEFVILFCAIVLTGIGQPKLAMLGESSDQVKANLKLNKSLSVIKVSIDGDGNKSIIGICDSKEIIYAYTLINDEVFVFRTFYPISKKNEIIASYNNGSYQSNGTLKWTKIIDGQTIYYSGKVGISPYYSNTLLLELQRIYKSPNNVFSVALSKRNL